MKKSIAFSILFSLILLCFSCSQKVNVSNNEEIEVDKKNYEKFVKFINKKKKSEVNEKEDVESKYNPQDILDEALEECQYAREYWQKNKTERAILSLDNAYELLLKIRSTKNPEIARQREDIRFLISKRLVNLYASKTNSVKGNYKEIPVILNKYVQREIVYLTEKQRTFFIESLQRSGKYRSQIVEELKKAGLPVELSWLPLVESGFKAKAFSKARALGLWQFIASTGYKFGLKRNAFLDERLDFEKSTKAAIAYLKALHNIFGDWATALAAYNCGERRVLREIRKQNLSYKDDFWDIYEKLPNETSRYYPRFIATLHIVENLEKYGFDNVKLDDAYQYDVVSVNKQVSLKDISNALKVNTNEIENLNSALVHKILPNEKYNLKVPKGKGGELLAVLDKIKTSNLPMPKFVYYKVRYGDSISTIAKKFRTSLKSVVRANKINKKNYIAVGQVLKIPSSKAYRYDKNKSSFRYVKLVNYKVKDGDSLWLIAEKFFTSVNHIASINKLKNNKIFLNQTLKIPLKSVKISKR